jgi:hypothetical protein
VCSCAYGRALRPDGLTCQVMMRLIEKCLASETKDPDSSTSLDPDQNSMNLDAKGYFYHLKSCHYWVRYLKNNFKSSNEMYKLSVKRMPIKIRNCKSNHASFFH